MMRRDDDGSASDDDLLPRLFRALGRRPQLPDDMKRGWEETFSRELQKGNLRRRRQRLRYVAAACAGVAILGAAIGYLKPESPVASVLATVAMVSGNVEIVDAQAIALLHVGDQVRAGQSLRLGSTTFLALRFPDADVRLNSNAVLVLHASRLQLVRGDLYVDAGQKSAEGSTLTIETKFGTLAHVGTQFLVSAGDNEVRVSVREGAVAINGISTRRTITAGDGAVEAALAPDGTLITRAIANTGGRWSWVVEAAPRHTIDGCSADDLLVWATRQLGTKLNYATPATRIHAQSVVLHGGIRTVSVAQGLAVLRATTDLAIDQSDAAVLHVRASKTQ